MSLLLSANAAGLDPHVYFRDVPLRIAGESVPAKLVLLGWREQFSAERDPAIAQILGR